MEEKRIPRQLQNLLIGKIKKRTQKLEITINIKTNGMLLF